MKDIALYKSEGGTFEDKITTNPNNTLGDIHVIELMNIVKFECSTT